MSAMITADLKSPTPIQRTIAERRRAFHASIAARAAALEASRPKKPIAQDIKPQAFPAEPDPPEPVYVKANEIAAIWPASTVDLIAEDRCLHITMDNISRKICAYMGITRAHIMSLRRTKTLVRGRQVGYYLARQLTDRSWPQISAHFGGRDHTTALYGAGKVAKEILTDAELAHDVAFLIEQLTGVQS